MQLQSAIACVEFVRQLLEEIGWSGRTLPVEDDWSPEDE
jgi:hypothetical protein